MKKNFVLSIGLLLSTATGASSAVCDYRLSQLVNPTVAAAVIAGSGGGALLRMVSLTADEKLFKLFEVSDDEASLTGVTNRIRVADGSGAYRFYAVKDLYIVNGELLHRDRFLNTPLGNIAVAVIEEE